MRLLAVQLYGTPHVFFLVLIGRMILPFVLLFWGGGGEVVKNQAAVGTRTCFNDWNYAFHPRPTVGSLVRAWE